ncbi:MAG: hypothetical protein OEZ35_04960 [Candidatus Bathyarchaeota archaeon]|nr:hypothetical protein [Candidatus Bathyarchaeota archaeon]
MKIAVFAIIASLLSTQVVTILFGVLGLNLLAFLSMLLGGFLNLSFPFSYNIWNEGRILLPPPYNISQWIRTYEIRVPAISVLQLVPQGSIERSLNGGWGWVRVLGIRVVFLEMEIGSIPPDFTYAIGTLFLFFMLVNVTGGAAGLFNEQATNGQVVDSQ